LLDHDGWLLDNRRVPAGFEFTEKVVPQPRLLSSQPNQPCLKVVETQERQQPVCHLGLRGGQPDREVMQGRLGHGCLSYPWRSYRLATEAPRRGVQLLMAPVFHRQEDSIMAKLIFSDEAQEIWNDIVGIKGLGLTSIRTENLVNILERDLGLRPVMCRFGDDFVPYEGWVYFRDDRRIPEKPDEWCSIYYAPQDCDDATGSNAHNWTQWAGRLLKYGRGSHPFAPRMKPPKKVQGILEAEGRVDHKVRTFRFITLEIVVFYLAVQIRTWKDPGAILTIKDLITKQTDIDHISFIPPAEDVNMDGLFPDEEDTAGNGTPSPKPPRSIPKAGHGLVAYNPSDTPAQPEAAPESGSVVALDLSSLDDDELDLQLQALLEERKERKARKLRATFKAEAEQAVIVHEGGQVWPDRGEYATMKVTFPNGKTITYYHQQLMEQKAADADWAANLLPE
jgi:hypothetical protein